MVSPVAEPTDAGPAVPAHAAADPLGGARRGGHIIFLWMLDGSFGVVNAGCASFGIEGPAWYIGQNTALFAVTLPTIWKPIR